MDKTTLLIIDDEEILLENVADFLGHVADQILTCVDPKKAIQILRDTSIDCVICDIFMPGMNGVEVIKKAREMGNEVPFIFYTGHGNKELMLEVAKYGAFDFIDKPNMDGLEHSVFFAIKTWRNREDKKTSDDSNIRDYNRLLEKLRKQDEE